MSALIFPSFPCSLRGRGLSWENDGYVAQEVDSAPQTPAAERAFQAAWIIHSPITTLNSWLEGNSAERSQPFVALLLIQQRSRLRLVVMHVRTVIKPLPRGYFQSNLISPEAERASCRFPHMVARCTTVIKCLLWRADLAVVGPLILSRGWLTDAALIFTIDPKEQREHEYSSDNYKNGFLDHDAARFFWHYLGVEIQKNIWIQNT